MNDSLVSRLNKYLAPFKQRLEEFKNLLLEKQKQKRKRKLFIIMLKYYIIYYYASIIMIIIILQMKKKIRQVKNMILLICLIKFLGLLKKIVNHSKRKVLLKE